MDFSHHLDGIISVKCSPFSWVPASFWWFCSTDAPWTWTQTPSPHSCSFLFQVLSHSPPCEVKPAPWSLVSGVWGQATPLRFILPFFRRLQVVVRGWPEHYPYFSLPTEVGLAGTDESWMSWWYGQASWLAVIMGENALLINPSAPSSSLFTGFQPLHVCLQKAST